MSDKHKCSAVAEWTGKPCKNNATASHDGKWFCGKHNPEKEAKPKRAPKLTDDHVKMLTGASAALPKNVTAVAARLRKLLAIHKVEFITVYRDKPTVRYARYQESEAAL